MVFLVIIEAGRAGYSLRGGLALAATWVHGMASSSSSKA